MPITNFASLTRFSDVCGAEIPRWIRKQLEAYADDIDSLQAFGLDVVSNLCNQLLEQGAPGLHFYTLNQRDHRHLEKPFYLKRKNHVLKGRAGSARQLYEFDDTAAGSARPTLYVIYFFPSFAYFVDCILFLYNPILSDSQRINPERFKPHRAHYPLIPSRRTALR